MIALRIALSRAARSGLKPTPSSMNVDMPPVDADLAAVGRVDAGHALQQRALARAVAPDDAEELARARRANETSLSASNVVVLARRGADAAHAP